MSINPAPYNSIRVVVSNRLDENANPAGLLLELVTPVVGNGESDATLTAT